MVEASRRELRDLRLQCQRLSSNNQELKVEADAGRMAACCSKRAADAARKELESERKLSGELRGVRDALLAAAAGDAKTISRLQAQLCKGAPSFRLMERARCLKRAIERRESQMKEKAITLTVRTAELEKSRQEARALAAALGVRIEKSSPSGEIKGGPTTVEELLEMGRVKLANHDLALEMANLSETSEILASEKQELDGRLSKKAAELEECYAETAKMRDIVDRERKAADVHRTGASVANASARKAEELVESLRSKEKELVRDMSIAARRHEELENKLKALSGAAERSEVIGARAEKLQTELDACGAELATEKLRNAQTCAELRASEERWHRARQRVAVLEKVEGEKRRVENLMREAEKLQTTHREDVASAREELRVAVAERTELLRGLRQAKGFNDELAKKKERAEQREEEACARCVEIREGKRALLEQLSATRAELREERGRCRKAEATLGRLDHAAGPRSRYRTSPSDNDVSDSDGEGSSFLFEDGCGVGGNATSTSAPVQLARPRDAPVVQDQLGKEGAERFLSDWDEERSSTSSSVSLSSSTLLMPPPPAPLLRPVPLGSVSIVAFCGGTNGGEGESGVSVESSTEAMPRQPLPLEAASSPSDNTPGRHSPDECFQRSDPRQSGHAEPSALAGACLNDPSLEGWAASMVVLGRAARAGAAPGDGAEPQSGLGRDLPFAAAIQAPGEACATPGGARGRQTWSSAGRRHRSVRVLGNRGASRHSPPESQEDRRCRQRQGRVRGGLLPQAHSPTKRPPEEEEEGEEKEGKKKERKMGEVSVGDGAVETVAKRTAGTRRSETCSSSPLYRGPSGREGCVRSGGTGGIRDDGGGYAGVRGAAGGGNRAGVVAGADRGHMASSARSGCGGDCQEAGGGEGETVDVAAAVCVVEGEHTRLPRCSLLDLAYQSIEDI